MSMDVSKKSVYNDESFNRRGRNLFFICSGVVLLFLWFPFLLGMFYPDISKRGYIYLFVFIGAFPTVFFLVILSWGSLWALRIICIFVAVVTTIPILIALTAIGIYLIEGDYSDLIPVLIALIIILIPFFAAIIMAYSEAINDFLAFKRGDLLISKWNELIKIKKEVRPKKYFNSTNLLSGVPERERLGKRIFVTATILSYLSWAVFIAAMYIIPTATFEKFDTMASEDIEKKRRQTADDIENIFVSFAYLLVIIGYAIVAFICSAILIFICFWLLHIIPLFVIYSVASKFDFPVRFLVLRPFNRSWITNNFVKTLQNEVSALGHLYSLADSKVRVPFYIRTPFIFGSMFSFRLQKIRKPKHIERIVKGMNQLSKRNKNWVMSKSKIFPISCVDSGWKACVTILVQEVDVILMDASELTENIIWEIELLRKTDSLKKTVFLHKEADQIKLKQNFMELYKYKKDMKVVTYSEDSIKKNGILRLAVVDILKSMGWG